MLPRHVLKSSRGAAADGKLWGLRVASETVHAAPETEKIARAREHGHLEQLNEHRQRLLVANAGDAAAVAGHVVHNLHSTSFNEPKRLHRASG